MGNVVILFLRTTIWLEGNIDCIANVREICIPPVIYWVTTVSRINFVIVVGECKYLKISAIIMLEDINVDVNVLMVVVEEMFQV